MNFVEKALQRSVAGKGIDTVKISDCEGYKVENNTLYINGNLKLNKVEEIISSL